MQCEDLSDALAAAADGTAALDLESRHHIERCLRCQAELVQYRRLLRALRTLRHQLLEPNPGLLADILATISEAGERHAVRSMLTGRRVAYVGGIAAATAAASAGAVVLVARSRSRRLRPAS
ncbi:MAG: hypothetical protein ACRD29_16700 [Acidimicrobiales bacterium]